MKLTLSASEAANRLRRNSEDGLWSRNGARALVDYLMELEKELGEEMEFNEVDICCNYREYDSAEEAAEGCGWNGYGQARGWLKKRTTVIDIPGGGVVIARF